MVLRSFVTRFRRLDLQVKIILVLIAVILPTFLAVSLAQHQLTRPLLEDELRQIGVTTAQNLATKIQGLSQPTERIHQQQVETWIQELIYQHPEIVRMDWILRSGDQWFVLASNVDEESSPWLEGLSQSNRLRVIRKDSESGNPIWMLEVPVFQKTWNGKLSKKILGRLHVVVSLKSVESSMNAFFRVNAIAAACSVFLLIALLSYFLRKTINNNVFLTEKLQETQRLLMNSERLAVMGQLTASFAHEIGTPLNAMSGHLQLLEQEIENNPRMEIIGGQLEKIESIVKGFLQNTAKPTSQAQLSDLNQILDRALHVVRPRLDSHGIEVKTDLNRQLSPLYVIPVELEQVFLNLFNNAIDSLVEKQRLDRSQPPYIELISGEEWIDGRPWVRAAIKDNGVGIQFGDLTNVFKPFFTTKESGKGTGLGLTICEQIAKRYQGELQIESKEKEWTQVALKLPCTPELA